MQYSTNGPKKIAVIGAGIGGLTVAAWLAKAGYQVTVFEKNAYLGGRAASFKSGGFVFELGPTWYGDVQMMEDFFAAFDHRSADFYRLRPLANRYAVYFADQTKITVPADFGETKTEFAAWEQGADKAVSHLVAHHTRIHERIVRDFWSRPLIERRNWLTPQMGWLYTQLGLRQSPFETLVQHVNKTCTRSYLRSVLLAPFIAMGLSPDQTAALYATQYFAQFDQIPMYPSGGMGEVPKAIAQVGWERGVQTITHAVVEQILIKNGAAVGVQVNGEYHQADAVIVAADYQQAEQQLLPAGWRTMPPLYWQQATHSKTVYTIFLGLKEKLAGLGHHTYYLRSAAQSATNQDHGWVSQPDFYCAIASQTDWQAAPQGGETVRLSVVLDQSLVDTHIMRQKYFNHLLGHVETVLGQSLRDKIVYQRVFSHQQYLSEWGSAQPTALGLQPSPDQLLWRRPPAKSAKLNNVYYVGQTIDPGPGLQQVMAGAARVSQQVHNDVQ